MRRNGRHKRRYSGFRSIPISVITITNNRSQHFSWPHIGILKTLTPMKTPILTNPTRTHRIVDETPTKKDDVDLDRTKRTRDTEREHTHNSSKTKSCKLTPGDKTKSSS